MMIALVRSPHCQRAVVTCQAVSSQEEADGHHWCREAARVALQARQALASDMY